MSKTRFDKLLVVDCEMTCWGKEPPPANEQSEIVQIGICSLIVATGEITDQASFIIKPRHSSLSDYFISLTGITPAKVKNGLMFDHVCNKIAKDYGSKHRIWAAYGNDREAFMRECELKNATYPFSQQYIDISTLFHLRNKLISGGVGLERALRDYYNFDFIGRPHDALADSMAAAELLKHLL